MRRFRPGLARLLPLLLLVQWAAATLPHARALAALGGATAVELCSAHGARTVLLGADGQPLDEREAPDCCTLGPLPAAPPPSGPTAPSRPVAVAPAEHAALRPGLPPLPPRAPPQLPRAPPAA
ncbi:hypothetical protein EAH89_19285 [Roseomonas nepalensis]|uniref:DUF2946 domain-containing protein n=1 Tax=Muricoccus nepalensis TaxID=1854500 RepID=A0A502FR66_9PROT|nr:hypothetical protein [Roseomonas nepalensis]TPG51901.1 hypothetical protein EAH89_19285 [Roseomonas nepalensis]